MTPQLLTPRILWAAMLASQAVYAGLIVGGVAPPASPDFDATFVMAIGAVAVVCAVVSFALPAYFRRPMAERIAAWARSESPEDAEIRKRAFQAGFVPFILAVALSEAVSIYGLVIAFTAGPHLVALGFVAAGAMLILVRFPTEATFLAPIEERLGRTLRH